MSVQDEIFEWVQSFESWKQELFVCAASSPQLGEADAEVVAKMLLGEAVEGRGPREVSRSDFPAAEGADQPMFIKRICDLENVNVIANGQSLAFEPDGLNVVWGANGAGKTGYSRILKHAGRTLHREGVLTNVKAKDASVAPSATIVVSIGGEEHEVSLDLLHGTPPALLGRICIADSKAGEIYLTKETEVDYVPTTLASLSRLAAGLNAVKAVLQRRLEAIETSPMDPRPFGEGTAAGQLVGGLDAKTSEEGVKTVAQLSKDDLAKRAALRKKVGELDAMQAPQLRRAAERDVADASRLLEDLKNLAAPLRESALEVARERDRSLREAREAAALAAKRFEGQPLGEVGSEPWRLLWSAARQYASHLGQALPPDHDPACCPLCMQELGSEARDRLRDFEQFVADDVNAKLKKLEDEVEESRLRIPDAETVRAGHQSVLERLGIADGEPGRVIDDWLDLARNSLRLLKNGEFDDLASIEVPSELSPWIDARKLGAERQAAIERGEESEKTRHDLAEIDGRHLLSERVDEVLGRLAALREIDRLEKAMAETNTSAVSRKIGTFSQQLIQAGLEEALNKQLKALEFRALEVVPKTRIVSGRSMVYLRFKSVDDVPLTDVLSHGEQRRLSLAMFLAEMEVLSDPSPIVLDDPTSSIDQEGRRQIARTLGQLAENRQVISFTHELSFVFELGRQAPEGLSIHTQHVYRQGETVGHVRPSLPWEGLSPADRVGPLRDRLLSLKKLRESHDEDDYRDKAARFCSLLRESIERTVEDRILAGVVQRRIDDVQTKKLRQVNCSEEICEMVDRGMSGSSPWVHDQALADGSEPPTPDELREGLDLYIELLAKLDDADRERKKGTKKRKAERVTKLKAVESGRADSGQLSVPDLKPVPDAAEPASADIAPTPDQGAPQSVKGLDHD